MDTTPQYTNILNAIGAKKASDEKLSTADRVENYNLLEKLNAQGIKLSDLMKKAEQNEPKGEDPEVFSIMESAVKNDPEVKEARQRVADVKSSVLVKICYQYPEYKEAIDNYRHVVSKIYKQKAVSRPTMEEEVSEVDLSEMV